MLHPSRLGFSEKDPRYAQGGMNHLSISPSYFGVGRPTRRFVAFLPESTWQVRAVQPPNGTRVGSDLANAFGHVLPSFLGSVVAVSCFDFKAEFTGHPANAERLSHSLCITFRSKDARSTHSDMSTLKGQSTCAPSLMQTSTSHIHHQATDFVVDASRCLPRPVRCWLASRYML